MTLPTFLGIGVMRGGSTWLHELLASHPDVWVPTRRKEVRFFDQFYARGLRWYEGFFPGDAEAGRYAAIGEVTPNYLVCAECPERIARVPSIRHLLVILRNPVDRAYSHYALAVEQGHTSLPFEAFMVHEPEAVQWGFYSRYLAAYRRTFAAEQMTVLIHERATADVGRAQQALAECLGLDASRFPEGAGTQRVNRSYLPRARPASALAYWVGQRLIAWDMDWVFHAANRLGVTRKRLFGVGGTLPPMAEATRRELAATYRDDVAAVEALLGTHLDCWRE